MFCGGGRYRSVGSRCCVLVVDIGKGSRCGVVVVDIHRSVGSRYGVVVVDMGVWGVGVVWW